MRKVKGFIYNCERTETQWILLVGRTGHLDYHDFRARTIRIDLIVGGLLDSLGGYQSKMGNVVAGECKFARNVQSWIRHLASIK